MENLSENLCMENVLFTFKSEWAGKSGMPVFELLEL